MVHELQRYRLTIAGIQETKWFEADVWPAGVFLHSGRLSPPSDDVTQCAEGVGIALGLACCWRCCVVTAQLKLTSAGLRQADSTRYSFDLFLTVTSVYVPNIRAPRHIKEIF